MENYFGKPAQPCGDCVDGYCTMNCSSAPAPEPKAPRYTADLMGNIKRDGVPVWLATYPPSNTASTEEMARRAQRIADLLNQHGEG